MSHQQLPAHALHRDGHARTPGPDPRPRHRGSTEPQKVESTTPIAAKQPKRRRGKKCGSSKPKYELAKAVLNLIFQQGQFELDEERREAKVPLSETKSSENADAQTLEQMVLEDLGMGKTPEAESHKAATTEDFFIATFIIEAGQEVPLFRGSISGQLLREEQLPTSQQSRQPTQAETSAKLKIREVLASLKEVRVSVNLGKIAQAALNNPKLAKLLENYHPPSKEMANNLSRKAAASKTGAFPTSHQGQKPKSKAQKKLH